MWVRNPKIRHTKNTKYNIGSGICVDVFEAKLTQIKNYFSGESVMNRITLLLICSSIFYGCADSTQNTTSEEKTTIPASQTKTASQSPSDTKPVSDNKLIDPYNLLVPGTITVDVMAVGGTPRANELGKKVKQAIAKNPSWFAEHNKKHRKNMKPGEPLPYDERMGLSKSEYKEFLMLSKKMTTQKIKQVPLIITKKGDDTFVLDGGKELSDLTGIEIDLKNDQVQTPFGILAKRSIVNASERSALGAWTGVRWELEQLDSNSGTGTVASLAIGKIKQSGMYVFYYDVRKVMPDAKAKIRISHILKYNTP